MITNSSVYHETPRSQARRAQTDRLGFCKGGALLSTKWTFAYAKYHVFRVLTNKWEGSWRYREEHHGKEGTCPCSYGRWKR